MDAVFALASAAGDCEASAASTGSGSPALRVCTVSPGGSPCLFSVLFDGAWLWEVVVLVDVSGLANMAASDSRACGGFLARESELKSAGVGEPSMVDYAISPRGATVAHPQG